MVRAELGATEESEATGVQRAKRRDSRTEDRCQPALASLTGLSAHPLRWVGTGSWGPGFGGQIPERGLGLAAWTQPEGASAPQLAGREYGKKSGPAGKARDHCPRVCKESGFLLRVPTDDRTPPTRAPETGVSHSYHLGPLRWVQNTTTATAATKDPVCKCRSLLPPSQEPVQHATARVPWSRANFPRRTHSMLQAVATSLWPLPIQACPAFQLRLLYLSLSPAWVSKRALISHYFNPLISGWGTDTWGQPICRGGAKTKAEPQELCEQRREREISPCSLSSSGLNPHNQLGKPCMCGIPE